MSIESSIQSIEELRALYGVPNERSRRKQMHGLEAHARNFLGHSPFMILSTYDADGNVDTSPRGGEPGFVHVLNDGQIAIPDSHGNKRLDSLVNIVETGRVGTLFLIPGVDETLRINGKASITQAPELLQQFSGEKKPPQTCIVLDVEEMFLHCAKAFMRSKLWSPEVQIERSGFPTLGKMINDQIGLEGEPETQEAMLERYAPDL
ncbi:MAG: PPOX class probable FMN-dependent enzyme [Myxococcota bacterium]|jgi:PPOX class probable FMN-dependent enzyme